MSKKNKKKSSEDKLVKLTLALTILELINIILEIITKLQK